jgi:hypothetical protein
MATNVTLNRSEVKVLIALLNDMLDDGQEEVTVANSSDKSKLPIFVLETRELVFKLLIAGLKSGDVTLPLCFRGNAVLEAAAAIGKGTL